MKIVPLQWLAVGIEHDLCGLYPVWPQHSYCDFHFWVNDRNQVARTIFPSDRHFGQEAIAHQHAALDKVVHRLADIGLGAPDGRAYHICYGDVRNLQAEVAFWRERFSALDEAAALTPWGSNSVWSGSGLLVTFHNETWGGEKFFQLLAKLSQSPREHINLLELINYCLLLGFEGRYRVMENGRSQLETMKQRLLQLIRSVRGGYAPPLSPHALDLPVQQKLWRPLVPLWACVALTGFLASLLFIALNWRLGDNTSPVLAAIYQTNLPQVAIGNPAPAAPPTLSLKSFLRKEIAEGLVVVRDEAQQSVVILKGDGLFDSAATTVRANYIPVIDRIAAAMNGVSGKILVTGYSDNVPIRSARFASNWELSLARADSDRTAPEACDTAAICDGACSCTICRSRL